MDKLDLFSASDLIKFVRDYLSKCGCDFKIIQEFANDDEIRIAWESHRDGLPYTVDANRIDNKPFTVGCYYLFADIKENAVFFQYVPYGFDMKDKYRAPVSVVNNQIGFKQIKNKIDLEKIVKEWNDNFETYGMYFSYTFSKSDYRNYTYTSYPFCFRCRL